VEEIAGYARILARMRVKQAENKRLLGKSYLKYGQCAALWGYLFQVGAVLGSKHADNLDEFGHAFLGLHGPPGAAGQFFKEIADGLREKGVNESMKFWDYVSSDFASRVGYEGDVHVFLLEHGTDKLDPHTAETLAWEYAARGAALGTVYPELARAMFEQTHTVVPTEDWKHARDAGLDIPAEQDVMTYDEVDEGENTVFMAYCNDVCPDLFSVLGT
jgi:hypothetical protein